MLRLEALSTVALPHEAPHRRGTTTHAGRRVGVFEARSRLFRLAEAFGFEPFELLGYGRFDNRGEVVAGHECGEPFELVAELGARGELHQVACW